MFHHRLRRSACLRSNGGNEKSAAPAVSHQNFSDRSFGRCTPQLQGNLSSDIPNVGGGKISRNFAFVKLNKFVGTNNQFFCVYRTAVKP